MGMGGRAPAGRGAPATCPGSSSFSVSKPMGGSESSGFTPDSLGLTQNICVQGVCVACAHMFMCCVCVQCSGRGQGHVRWSHREATPAL